MRYTLLALILISSFAHADQKSAHKEGKAFASEQLANSKDILKTNKASDVPGFQTDQPAEAGMSVGQLASGKARVLEQNGHAAFVAKTINERPFIKIDLLHDPVIQHAQEAAANPEATIAQVETFSDLDAQPTRHTCEESRDDAKYVCSQTRIIETDVAHMQKHVVTLEVKTWRWKHGLGRNVITDTKLDQSYVHPKGKFQAYTRLVNPLPQGSVESLIQVRLLTPNKRVTVSPNGDVWIRTTSSKGKKLNMHLNLQLEITYRAKVTDQQIKEHVEDSCGPLQEKAALKLCHLAKEGITEGAGAHEFNGHSIHRPWWKKEFTYQCHFPSQNTCEPYRQQGCDLVGTTCKTKLGDTCVVSEQTYLCRKKARVCRHASDHGAPFCVDGNCASPTMDANKDMMEAISRLSVLKDIQGEISQNDLHVFKGGSQSCKNYITSYKNCCGSGQGWGKSLGIAGCSGEEKILEENRSKHLCRKIGTYCSEKVLGVCISEKTTFCCFPTRMARVFHEQGRKQLGMGWGDKKHPDCRGFTIEELSRIDFSKLDLSELYQEITKSMKKPDLNKISKSLQNRVETMVIDTDKEKGVKVG